MREFFCVSLVLGVTAVNAVSGAEVFSFKKHTVNAQSAFETCGVGDINRDVCAAILGTKPRATYPNLGYVTTCATFKKKAATITILPTSLRM